MQLNKVTEYIGKHLDEQLSLSDLSKIAGCSEYHFHRLFTAHVGLSLYQYIRWLRLKRAAHQLIIDKNQPILDIALQAGFESHEAFSRAFKQACGVTPRQFREESSWQFWEQPAYRLTNNQGAQNMNVNIKEIEQRRLAVLEHRGDPKYIGNSVNTLINWAKSQRINLKPAPGEAFGFAYDDPHTTPPEEFRFDLAITIPNNISCEGDVFERILPAGRYATVMHKGSRENIGDVIYALYRDWLPQSGETLGELPCIFCYHNFEHEVAETELLTECWLQLK